ncbi:C2H2-type domain-containing protein [Heracleum sosnowskyi]|uniref:C2H2-type domain-containing protein n=1 Tax=Heracleum sosnowskyi TaxID=360622 RepID=A0AAD8N709_9APIA|nr:C2H2-type domain-containing protein [Heracleum sosnowskyi]
MSKTIVQPVGQKRLTNVAVVRLKKHGCRFEIACYKNKVLSWRSGVEKDLDEVLQSHTVYSNVSKGVLAKSRDLKKAFGNDEHDDEEKIDHEKICLEILEKGELQVAGKERESQLSIDPHNSSKKQALEVIRELQKSFPIKRSPMRLRLTVPGQAFSSVSEKLNEWKSSIVSKEESGNQLSVICEMDPGFFRDCDAMVRNLQGRLEILAISVHAEGDTNVDHYDDHEEPSSNLPKASTGSVSQLSEKLQKQTVSEKKADVVGDVKQQSKCSTCNAYVGDSKQYREHFKSEWHKHNLRRKTKQLPPLSAEECMGDMEISDSRADLKDYSF